MIKISCNLCDESFQSLLLDRRLAMGEVGPAIQKHLIENHKAEWDQFTADLGKITTLAAGIASVNRFLVYSPDDLASLEEHETNCNALMELLGFDDETDPDSAAPTISDITGKKGGKKKNLIIMPN